MVIFVSLVVALIGLLIYVLTKQDNPKVVELGRIMFFCGLFVFLLQLGPHIVSLLGGAR